jgi:hypothetical protein
MNPRATARTSRRRHRRLARAVGPALVTTACGTERDAGELAGRDGPTSAADDRDAHLAASDGT